MSASVEERRLAGGSPAGRGGALGANDADARCDCCHYCLHTRICQIRNCVTPANFSCFTGTKVQILTLKALAETGGVKGQGRGAGGEEGEKDCVATVKRKLAPSFRGFSRFAFMLTP